MIRGLHFFSDFPIFKSVGIFPICIYDRKWGEMVFEETIK